MTLYAKAKRRDGTECRIYRALGPVDTKNCIHLLEPNDSEWKEAIEEAERTGKNIIVHSTAIWPTRDV